MTKLKRTPWYPSSIKPVRVGNYEYAYTNAGFEFDCWWNGKDFFINEGKFKGHKIHCFASDQWRGLAAKP